MKTPPTLLLVAAMFSAMVALALATTAKCQTTIVCIGMYYIDDSADADLISHNHDKSQ